LSGAVSFLPQFACTIGRMIDAAQYINTFLSLQTTVETKQRHRSIQKGYEGYSGELQPTINRIGRMPTRR